jgi:hypothetical protein
MKKYILSSMVLLIFGIQFSYAQVSIGVGVGRGYGRYGGYYGNSMNRYNRYPQRVRRDSMMPKFNPIITASLGYGFPNLDGSQLAGFFNYNRGNISQSGPVIGSIDFQYSRTSSIGLMVMHGQVSAPYYDFSGSQAFTGSQDNWSIMVNMMNYMPTNTIVEPYIRTAIGVNIWNQNYVDVTGNKMGYVSEPGLFAYQVSLGANFRISKVAGFYTEVGYGKYILQAGLKFRLTK